MTLHFSNRWIALVGEKVRQRRWGASYNYTTRPSVTVVGCQSLTLAVLTCCHIYGGVAHCTSPVVGFLAWWNNFDRGQWVAIYNCTARPSVTVLTRGVGTLENGYLRNVPLPRIQSTNQVASVLICREQDVTCYSRIEWIPPYRELGCSPEGFDTIPTVPFPPLVG